MQVKATDYESLQHVLLGPSDYLDNRKFRNPWLIRSNACTSLTSLQVSVAESSTRNRLPFARIAKYTFLIISVFCFRLAASKCGRLPSSSRFRLWFPGLFFHFEPRPKMTSCGLGRSMNMDDRDSRSNQFPSGKNEVLFPSLPISSRAIPVLSSFSATICAIHSL